jgi:hypothetical protein
VNATVNHVLAGMGPFVFDEGAPVGGASVSVGPLPSFFLLVCIAGVIVTAMVTLKRARASAGGADEQHVRERKPLVASGVEPATGEEFAGTYQETNY